MQGITFGYCPCVRDELVMYSKINKKLTIHIYRRYFASVGTKKNIRPDTLKTLMGHSDYRTTLRYISQSSDDIHSQFDKIY